MSDPEVPPAAQRAEYLRSVTTVARPLLLATRGAAQRAKSVAGKLTRHLDHVLRLADTVPGLVATAALGVLALLCPVSVPNWLSLSPYSAVWLLTGLSAVAIAALTLFYALYVFRGQYVLARLPATLAGRVLVASPHRAALVRLLTVLVTALVALGPVTATGITPSTVNVATVCLILLALSFIRLPADTRRLFAGGYTEAVVSTSLSVLPLSYLASIDPDFSRISPAHQAGVRTKEADPFALLEQVFLRCLRDGDFTTCARLLRGVTAQVWTYLDRDGIPNSRNVLGWFGELLRVVGSRALAHDERVAEIAVWLAEETTVHAYRLGLTWDKRIEYSRALNVLRQSSIRGGSHTVISAFDRMATVCFREALARAPEERLIASLISPTLESSGETDSDAFLEWDNILAVGPYQLSDTMRLCAACSLPEDFASASMVLSMGMICDVVRSERLGNLQKRYLIRQLLSALRHSTIRAIRLTGSEDFVVWHLPGFLLRDLLLLGWDDLAAVALNDTGEVILEASKAGVLPYMVLNEAATAGRTMARQGNDTYAIMAAEILAAAAPILERHDSGPMRDMYLEAAEGLRSVARFDKREDSDTKQAVERLLHAFQHEAQRRHEWERELPTRARLASWPRWEAPHSDSTSNGAPQEQPGNQSQD